MLTRLLLPAGCVLSAQVPGLGFSADPWGARVFVLTLQMRKLSPERYGTHQDVRAQIQSSSGCTP